MDKISPEELLKREIAEEVKEKYQLLKRIKELSEENAMLRQQLGIKDKKAVDGS